MTGLLDLASPLLAVLDQAIAPLLPAGGRVALWGLVAASVSMAIYAVISPQQRLRSVKADTEEAKQALEQHDGSLAEAGPLIGRMLQRALLQLGLVLGPAILASLPVLLMIVWLSGAYGHFIPDSTQSVPLRVAPAEFAAKWQPAGPESGTVSPDDPAQIMILDPAEHVVEALAVGKAVTSLHKRRWWNVLIANPLGYLPSEGALESVEIGWPRQQVLSFGPDWMRGWEVIFFTVLLAGSLVIKLAFRLV